MIRIKPSLAEPSEAKPSEAKPSEPKPSEAKRSRLPFSAFRVPFRKALFTAFGSDCAIFCRLVRKIIARFVLRCREMLGHRKKCGHPRLPAGTFCA